MVGLEETLTLVTSKMEQWVFVFGPIAMGLSKIIENCQLKRWLG
jgi:hypothetical protein